MYDPGDSEKNPGGSPEEQKSYTPPDDSFDDLKNLEKPEGRWDQFGAPIESDKKGGGTSERIGEEKNQYDEGLTEAAALINYGLDAIAREIGVEAVIQGIKTFDASGSENPLRDLYIHLGIDTQIEFKDTQEEELANKHRVERLRSEYNMPKSDKRTREGLIKAIADMKELIMEVEGASPKYAELRQSASSAGKGCFEYAVQSYGTRGLAELFSTLAAQKEKPAERKPEERTNTKIENKPEAKPEEKAAEAQPDQNEEEKILPEPEQEQPDALEDLEEQDIENDIAGGALYQETPTEPNPEEQTPPDAGSEQEKDPSYRLGQEKKVA